MKALFLPPSPPSLTLLTMAPALAPTLPLPPSLLLSTSSLLPTPIADLSSGCAPRALPSTRAVRSALAVVSPDSCLVRTPQIPGLHGPALLRFPPPLACQMRSSVVSTPLPSATLAAHALIALSLSTATPVAPNLVLPFTLSCSASPAVGLGSTLVPEENNYPLMSSTACVRSGLITRTLTPSRSGEQARAPRCSSFLLHYGPLNYQHYVYRCWLFSVNQARTACSSLPFSRDVFILALFAQGCYMV